MSAVTFGPYGFDVTITADDVAACSQEATSVESRCPVARVLMRERPLDAWNVDPVYIVHERFGTITEYEPDDVMRHALERWYVHGEPMLPWTYHADAVDPVRRESFTGIER